MASAKSVAKACVRSITPESPFLLLFQEVVIGLGRGKTFRGGDGSGTQEEESNFGEDGGEVMVKPSKRFAERGRG